MLVPVLVRQAGRFRQSRRGGGARRSRRWVDFGDRVARLAAGLLAGGLAPGRAGVRPPTRPERLHQDRPRPIPTPGWYGWRSTTGWRKRFWARIANDAGATALIYDARYAERTEALRSGLGDDRVIVIGDGPAGSAYEKIIEGHTLSNPPRPTRGRWSHSTTRPAPPAGPRALPHHHHRLQDLVNIVTEVIGGAPAPRNTLPPRGTDHATGGLLSFLPFLVHGSRQLILPAFEVRPGAVVEAVAEDGGRRALRWFRRWSTACSD